jgi:archaellum biogenesis ATPase FlaH
MKIGKKMKRKMKIGKKMKMKMSSGGQGIPYRVKPRRGGEAHGQEKR